MAQESSQNKSNQLPLVSSLFLLPYPQLIIAGLVFVVGQAGAAIFPSLIGLIASRAGVQVLPPIVVGLIVAMGLTWAFVPKPLSHQE